MYKLVEQELPTDDGTKYTLSLFVKQMLRLDQRFGRNMHGVLAASRIDARPLEIESADFALLREACTDPTNGYPVGPAVVLAPFLITMRDAKEE